MSAYERMVAGIVVATPGVIVLAYSAGWYAVLGVFLLLWSNNISRSRE